MSHGIYNPLRHYQIGVDLGSEDYSAITVYRRPNWFELLLRKLRLSKATWEMKIVAVHYEDKEQLSRSYTK